MDSSPLTHTSLSRKLALYIVLSSSIVTFFTIVFLLYQQYESDVDKLEQRLNAIKLSSLPSIEKSLWEFNDQQVQTAIDSLMSLDDVVSVEVQGYTWDGYKKTLKAKNSRQENSNTLEKKFPITREQNAESIELGTLTIVASLENLQQSLKNQALYILITQGVKTFIITSLILLILQYLLIRHLNKISAHANTLKLNAPYSPLRLKRNRKYPDELDHVVNTLNNMHISFLEEQKKELQLQKQHAYAQANAKAKSDLLNHMSHEIRTPLNGIVGLLDLIEGNNLTEDQKRYLKTIKASSHSLIEIINNILDLSKIEANKLQLQKEKFSIAELIAECNLLYQAAANKKNIHISENIDSSLQYKFVGDPLRIKQILLNFLSNALKYTEEGEIIISAERLQDNTNNKTHIRFSVRDTGKGIKEINQNRIFEAFEQENVDSNLSGTGLGLNICKQLTALMNGSIGVNSKPDQGSEFWFTLPLEETQTHHSKAENDSGETITHKRLQEIKGATVLVAEDNDVNQEVIQSLLDQLEIESSMFSNGKELCDFAANNTSKKPCVVLMDCEMPVMNGFEASEKLRQIERETGVAKYTIISLSAYSDQNYQDKCKKAGMDLLITKPVTLNELEKSLIKVEQQFLSNNP